MKKIFAIIAAVALAFVIALGDQIIKLSLSENPLGINNIKGYFGLDVETIEISDPPAVANLSPRYDEIISGAKVAISDPAFPGKFNVIIGQKYRSALGVNCYQVELTDVALAFEPVAICRRDAGPWFVAPRIWARSTTGTR